MANLDIAGYNRLGQVFTACNQSAATVTLINTTTATGFILSNPYGSTKKMLLVDLTFAYTTVPAATAVLFIAMSSAPSSTNVVHTTPITVYGADGSGVATNAVGKADAAATTPAVPVYSRIIGYSPTTPATTGALSWTDRGEGSLIMVPGTYIQVSYITTAPVGITSATWIEVPV